ncbi:hypothetical protein ALP75_202728 [Pseudomonas syringae pv. actinidiae]|nr:hypothetical protein ALP75_202728 [Pseudomonas syringae pv. actinidiae]
MLRSDAQIRRRCVVRQHQRPSAARQPTRLPMIATGLETPGKYLDMGVLAFVYPLQTGVSQCCADGNSQRLPMRAVISLHVHALPLARRQPTDQITRQLPIRGAEPKHVEMLQRQPVNRCRRRQQRDTGLLIQRRGNDRGVGRKMANNHIGLPVDHVLRHLSAASGIGSVIEKVPLHPRKPRNTVACHRQRPHESPCMRCVSRIEQRADANPQPWHTRCARRHGCTPARPTQGIDRRGDKADQPGHDRSVSARCARNCSTAI